MPLVFTQSYYISSQGKQMQRDRRFLYRVACLQTKVTKTFSRGSFRSCVKESKAIPQFLDSAAQGGEETFRLGFRVAQRCMHHSPRVRHGVCDSEGECDSCPFQFVQPHRLGSFRTCFTSAVADPVTQSIANTTSQSPRRIP